MKNIYIILIFFFCSLVLISCEDPINIEIEGSKPQLSVDAFLNDSLAKQTIKLRFTKPYLDNGKALPALGAEVSVEDIIFERTFIFTDSNNDGDYEWIPSSTDLFPLGIPGLVYKLNIKYNGDQFSSFAKMDSVPIIDSLGYEFQKEEIQGRDTIKAGYTLTMISRDLPNQANGYWFKTYKNGKFYSKPTEMNLSYDAAFGPGSDGVIFIPPIVSSLSPERFQVGDSIKVECNSVGIPTWVFLNQALSQMNNSGLFATPVVNVPSNIENVNKNSGVKAIGWFCAASISRKALRIK